MVYISRSTLWLCMALHIYMYIYLCFESISCFDLCVTERVSVSRRASHHFRVAHLKGLSEFVIVDRVGPIEVKCVDEELQVLRLEPHVQLLESLRFNKSGQGQVRGRRGEA